MTGSVIIRVNKTQKNDEKVMDDDVGACGYHR